MVRKRVVEAMAVTALLMAAVLPSDAAVQSKAKPAVSTPKFTVLNPEAPLPEINTKALSPRLASLAGKTILIYDNHGGYEKPMAGLAAQLKPLLPPDANIVYYSPKTTTWTADDQKLIPKADAAIVGHGY
ncbi:MAG: hypothetical protein M0009_17210 [Deltaproteobacteria bacterium]|nr:hypothetical protein [Deltaproteobacteria bacterium]